MAVIGGGIAGMYCAWELADRGFDVTLLETSDRLGGRIETATLDGFVAEFGPMRFEKQFQPKLVELCQQLGIDLLPFPPPVAGEQEWPKYNLDPDELDPDGGQLDSLNLLRLGIYRMLLGMDSTECVDGTIPSGGSPPKGRRDWLVRPKDLGWLDKLDDVGGGFETLRRAATLRNEGKVYLHKWGLWEALEDVLSDQAVRKIKDQGTFFHLISENPNAIEWGIFWLRLFKLGPREGLSTIRAGVDTIRAELEKKLDTVLPRDHKRLFSRVVSLGPGTGRGLLHVEFDDWSVEPSRRRTLEVHQIILALPQMPLRKLSGQFPPAIREDLEGVIAIPLLKAFLVVDASLWKDPPRTQEGAWRLPTRELHYFFSPPAEHKVMILLYTDRPASRFWERKVKGATHDRAEIGNNDALKEALVRLLLKERRRAIERTMLEKPNLADVAEQIAQELEEVISREWAADNGQPPPEVERALIRLRYHARFLLWVGDVIRNPQKLERRIYESVSAYGIRDWSREPFGAACHAWAPGARSWEVRVRVKAFGLRGQEQLRNVHICGEAYSDYQGFIEGSLRSAWDALMTIPGFVP